MKKNIRLAFICMMTILVVVFDLNIVLAETGSVTSPDEKITSINTSDDANFTVTKNVKWINDAKTQGELDIKLAADLVPTSSTTPKDIVFIADRSYSMAGDRLNYLKMALHSSAEILLDSKFNNRISLITFGTEATLEQSFTNKIADFQTAASNIIENGSTQYSTGLLEAKNLIENRNDTSRKPVIVFMSDGDGFDSNDSIRNISNRLKSSGVEIFAIQYMVGKDITESMKAVCPNEANIYMTNEAYRLNDLYKNVMQDVIDILKYEDISFKMNFEGRNFKVDKSNANIGIVNINGNTITWTIDSLHAQELAYVKLRFSLQNPTYEGNLNIDTSSSITYDDSSPQKIVLDDLAMNRKLYTVSFEANNATSGELPNQMYAVKGANVYVPENEGSLSKSDEVFAGWERIDTNTLLDKRMVMPEKNITLRAVWAKPEIAMNTSTIGDMRRYDLVEGNLYDHLTTIDLTPIVKVEFTHDRDVPAQTTPIDLSADNKGTILSWAEGSTLYIKSVGIIVAPKVGYGLFATSDGTYPANIENINFNDMFVTDQTTSFGAMFARNKKLKELDLSGFDTNIGSFYDSMFEDCESLTKVDISSLDISNATSLKHMFKNCKLLKEVDVSNFDTTNVESLEEMFTGCESLESLDLSSFNTINVEHLGNMFKGCTSLRNIDFSSFRTPNVKYAHSMFERCSSLETLDLSSFDVSSFDMFTALSMFIGCTNLITVWVKSEVEKAMFHSSANKPSNVNVVVKPKPLSMNMKDDIVATSAPSMISRKSHSGPVEVIDGVADAGEIQPSDVVHYDITVKYSGTLGLRSGTLKVVNRLPEGMTFVESSIVTALPTRVNENDGGPVSGYVNNEKVEGNVVSFDVIGLSPGAQIKIGYQAIAPATPTNAYKELLNQSTLSIEEVKATSNYVRHYFSAPDPTTMFDVEYVYDGSVPTNAPKFPLKREFTTGQSVNTVKVGLPGYKFSGWTSDEVSVNEDGSFVMPNKKATLKGSWSQIPVDASIKSKVSYEFKGAVPAEVEVPKEVAYTVGNNYNDVETITGKTISIAENPTSAGYVFKGWTSNQLSSDEIRSGAFELGKDDVVITGTWEKEKFKVEYKYLDTNPPIGAPTLPSPIDVAWGEEVVTKDKIDNLSTHGFDGWYSNNDIGTNFEESFIMPQEDVTIYGYWNDLSTSYDVSYEYEGETPDDAPSLGTNDSAIVGNPSIVRIDPVSAQGTDKNGVIGKWVFNVWESDDVTIASDGTFIMPSKNIKMKGSWTFEKNMNIRFVTFEIQNGTWHNGDTTDKVVTVELANGKTTLKDVDVPKGMYAKEGYTDGHWIVEPNTEIDGITDSIKYTYKYVKKPVVTFKIENGTWGDGSTANKNVDIELVKGKGSLSLMDVPTGMLAKDGYADGYWVVEPNISKNAVTEDIGYTYRFKKEAHVVFKITNGTWKDGSSANKDIIVLLTDGKGTLKATQVPVGMNAHKGYGNGKWVEVVNVKDGEVTGDVTYEYRYEALDTPGGIDPVNPEKPDVMNPTKPGKSDTNSTNTGDTLDWKLPMVVLMVSGVFVVVAWKKRSKKEVE